MTHRRNRRSMPVRRAEQHSDNSQKNNERVTRQRYRSVIPFKCAGCLLWQAARNVIAGHSWCKGEGRPLASAADPQSC